MLLDPKPKSKSSDLFGRKRELKILIDSLSSNPITIITGIRRIGKSSLMRVGLKEINASYLIIDARKMYTDSGGAISKFNLISQLQPELEKHLLKEKIKKALKNVKGFMIAGNSIEFNWKEINISDILEALNQIRKTFIIAIDEAQYLKYYGSRGGRDLQNMIAWAYDNLENIRFLLTGSEIGLLYDFLGVEDYDNPLFGRYLSEILLYPFSDIEAISFLKKALEEANCSYKETELVEAHKHLDGIVGHLVQYGLHRLKKSHPEALEAAYKVARITLKKELKELEKRSPRYITVLKYIASGAKKFSNIQKAFQVNGETISKSRIHDALDILRKTGWIEKKDNEWHIIDKVFEKLLKEE
ncbi:hypothetical protein AT15_03060 [Kosmotoga arenicorallina S304]|uniref:ATPase domain-containing protein n=1 Tax=Kosmotoga arenicorallina S304 TaxID=1453497 RepID=A0A182C7W7_9BACT|nr:ATP-binding protein [Kosmotoga arenicorallina]OAA31824.1 hypothetical protein AT15_03060 [Kosmotoga arenicorallina S304]